MDDDTDDLLAQLCARIGMTMEDATMDALTIGAMDEAERGEAIARLEAAASRISQLMGAVTALVDKIRSVGQPSQAAYRMAI